MECSAFLVHGRENVKLITERDRLRSVAQRWRDLYQTGRYGVDKLTIARQLNALNGETVEAAVVEQIIGNDSWTAVACHECGQRVTTAMQMGEEPDYESHTATLCHACLVHAVEVMDEYTAH